MPRFVERDLGKHNFFLAQNPDVIFEGNDVEAEKRKKNRNRIKREQGLPQEIGEADFNAANNRPKRRTRGKGRKINYKQP